MERTDTNKTFPSFSTWLLRKRLIFPSPPNVVSQVTPVDRSNVCPTTIFNIPVNGLRILLLDLLHRCLHLGGPEKQYTIIKHSDYKSVRSSVPTFFWYFMETTVKRTPLRSTLSFQISSLFQIVYILPQCSFTVYIGNSATQHTDRYPGRLRNFRVDASITLKPTKTDNPRLLKERICVKYEENRLKLKVVNPLNTGLIRMEFIYRHEETKISNIH
jgi:hypothetical protein